MWMVSDCGSKAFNTVEDTCDDCKVIKLDCVGHVQKRMGKHLLNLKARTVVYRVPNYPDGPTILIDSKWLPIKVWEMMMSRWRHQVRHVKLWKVGGWPTILSLRNRDITGQQPGVQGGNVVIPKNPRKSLPTLSLSHQPVRRCQGVDWRHGKDAPFGGWHHFKGDTPSVGWLRDKGDTPLGGLRSRKGRYAIMEKLSFTKQMKQKWLLNYVGFTFTVIL